MAAVYKKKYPIPMPDGAEIITRRGKKVAQWTNGKGQERTAEVLGNKRVQFVSDCWYVRYNDASGKMRRESTGCRDKQAAVIRLPSFYAVSGGFVGTRRLGCANGKYDGIKKPRGIEGVIETLK